MQQPSRSLFRIKSAPDDTIGSRNCSIPCADTAAIIGRSLRKNVCTLTNNFPLNRKTAKCRNILTRHESPDASDEYSPQEAHEPQNRFHIHHKEFNSDRITGFTGNNNLCKLHTSSRKTKQIIRHRLTPINTEKRIKEYSS